MYITLFADIEDCCTPLSDDVAKDVSNLLELTRLQTWTLKPAMMGSDEG